jgi:hypothetical protein
MSASSAKFSGWRTPNLRPRTIDPKTGKPKKKSGSSTNKTGEEGVDITYGDMSDRKSKIFEDDWLKAAGVTPTIKGQVQVHGRTPAHIARTRDLEKTDNGVAKIPSDRLDEFGMGHITTKAPYIEVLPGDYLKNSQRFNDALNTGASARDAWTPVTGADMTSFLLHLKSKGVNPNTARKLADRAAEVLNKKVLGHTGSMTEEQFGQMLNQAHARGLRSGYQPDMRPVIDPMGYDLHTRNRGLERTPFADGTVSAVPGYGGGDTVPALIERGESVVTKDGTRGNQGALTLINAGYSVDEIMGFEKGIVGYEKGIVGSAFSGARSEGFIGQGAFNKARTGGLSSPMAGMGIGMGMQGAAAMMGGQAGTIMQIASILPMISMAPITKLIKGITGIGGSLKTAGGAAKIFEMILKNAFKVGPILLLTAAITGVVILFKKWRAEVAENAKEQSMLNGLTEKGATEAGIKYNNLSDSIKGVKDQMDLFRASQLTAFNSQNSSGILGLTLTIKELQDKIKSAKTDMPEFVSSLNSLSKSATDNKKATTDMASNWKAQFVAGGMTIAEATNEIYAIIKASDMANHAFAAISNTGFTSIKDKGSAVTYMFEQLNKNMSKLSGQDLGNALSNVVIGIDSARQALVGTKDANGDIITQQMALDITMKKLNASAAMNKKLTTEQVDSLKKTHPELAAIVNSTDTIKSTYAKWKILLAGVDVNLKTLSATQATALAKFIELQNAAIAVAQTAKPGQDGYIASIAKSSTLIGKLNKQILAGGTIAEKTAQRTKDQIDAEMKAIDKRIKKIQEEADARIKAIQKTQSAESYAIELKQAQIELQAAIASGDKEAQVRAQLNLTALQKRHESEMAIASIQDDAAAKQKLEEERKAKLQEEIDALSKKVATAQGRAADVTIVRDKVSGYQSRRDALLARESTNSQRDPKSAAYKKEAKDISMDFSNLAKDASNDAKGKDKTLAAAIKEAFLGVLVNGKGESLGGKTVTGIPGSSPQYVEGTGMDVLKGDASQVTKRIDTTNKILGEIKSALGGGTTKSFDDSDFTSTFKGNQKMDSYKDKDGYLTPLGRQRIIDKYKLKKNDTFSYDNEVYRVTVGEDAKFRDSKAVRKELGGPFAAGQLIQMNDRINSLGTQEEGIMVRPDFSGFIYPNAATMPRYDIPSSGYSGYRNESPAGSSGSSPIINNYITAGPNMDIKQLAREVGMVTAKAVSRGGNNRGYSNGTQQVVNV